MLNFAWGIVSRDEPDFVEIPREVGFFHAFYRIRDKNGDLSRQDLKSRACTNIELGIEESDNTESLFFPALLKDSEKIIKKYSGHMKCFEEPL